MSLLKWYNFSKSIIWRVKCNDLKTASCATPYMTAHVSIIKPFISLLPYLISTSISLFALMSYFFYLFSYLLWLAIQKLSKNRWKLERVGTFHIIWRYKKLLNTISCLWFIESVWLMAANFQIVSSLKWEFDNTYILIIPRFIINQHFN